MCHFWREFVILLPRGTLFTLPGGSSSERNTARYSTIPNPHIAFVICPPRIVLQGATYLQVNTSTTVRLRLLPFQFRCALLIYTLIPSKRQVSMLNCPGDMATQRPKIVIISTSNRFAPSNFRVYRAAGVPLATVDGQYMKTCGCKFHTDRSKETHVAQI